MVFAIALAGHCAQAQANQQVDQSSANVSATPAPAAKVLASPFETGCPASVVRSGTEYIQGSDGVFFRLFPDLEMYFPMDAEVAAKVAAISKLLKAKGTDLVMLPVPARGTVMGRHLENVPIEITSAFDADIAAKSYATYVETLEKAGVATLNLMQVLSSKNDGTDYFLPTDHHWNPAGASASAAALKDFLALRGIGKDLAVTDFMTADTEKRILPSTMRREIQLSCNEALPPNAIAVTETMRAGSTDSASATDLFGEVTEVTPIVLTGTSFSDVDEFNFAGMISQSTGLDVANFAISGGNQFASILSYMTSIEFDQNRPSILLWENPVYNNLGAEGEAPLVELLVAASGACSPGVADPLQGTRSAGKFEADISPASLKNPNDTYLRIDVGDTSERTVEIAMASNSGGLVTQTITRASRFKTNGVFFAKLANDGITSLTVKSPRFNSEKAAITLCEIK